MWWTILLYAAVLSVTPTSTQFYPGFQRQDVDINIYEFTDPFQSDRVLRDSALSPAMFSGSPPHKLQGGGSYGGHFNSIPNESLGAKNNPIFEFLAPSGVRISLPGPHEESNVYLIKYYVSVNQELEGRSGQYTGQVTVPQGSAWSFMVPNLRVKYLDTIHYLVEVQGQQGYRSWTRDHRGYYQVPHRDPHGLSQVPGNVNSFVRPQSEVQSYRPVVTYTPASSDGTSNPKLEFFEPQGVRVTVPGSIEDSNVYMLKYHLNVNRDFNGVKNGQYNGELSIPKGNSLSFLEQGLRIKPLDTIYYWLEILGQNSARTWFKEYKGYYQIPNRGPQVAKEPLRPPLLPQPPSPPTQRPNYQTYATSPQTKVTQGQTYLQRPQTTPSVPQYSTRRQESCKQSTTTYNSGNKLCVGSSLDQFIILNSIEQIAGTEPEESFTVFSKENVVSNGGKYNSIKPTLLEDRYGDRFVDKSLTLPSCTSKNADECSSKASGYFILPPVLSGRQTTEDTLYFRYGMLEVTAKLPSGDWVVPELWLLPKTRVYGRDSGKIVLALARGNAQLYGDMNDYSSHVLEAGVQMGSGNHTLHRKTQDRPWSDDYHTFRLEWTPDELVFYVDNNLIGRTTASQSGLDSSLRGSKLAPFDQEFYLVFGIHVGGDQDFPDTVAGKPWKNMEPKNKLNFWRQRTQWHPTWSGDTALHISHIRLTALDY